MRWGERVGVGVGGGGGCWLIWECFSMGVRGGGGGCGEEGVVDSEEEGGLDWAGRGSFLSGDGLRYGSRWDHVQQVLSLPVC